MRTLFIIPLVLMSLVSFPSWGAMWTSSLYEGNKTSNFHYKCDPFINWDKSSLQQKYEMWFQEGSVRTDGDYFLPSFLKDITGDNEYSKRRWYLRTFSAINSSGHNVILNVQFVWSDPKNKVRKKGQIKVYRVILNGGHPKFSESVCTPN